MGSNSLWLCFQNREAWDDRHSSTLCPHAPKLLDIGVRIFDTRLLAGPFQMNSLIDRRLVQLQVILPAPSVPPAVYSPVHVAPSGLVHIAGQPPYTGAGAFIAGKVGAELSLAEGRRAARQSAMNVLAHLRAACAGNLDRVVACVRLMVLVNAAPEFTDVHRVADGASELIAEVFAPLPPPTRSSAGCATLPMNIATEVEALFLIDPKG